MTDSQLLAIALASAPTMITVLIGILINNARLGDVNARLGDIKHYMDARFNEVDRRFNGGCPKHRHDRYRRFEDLDRKMDYRFDDMKAMWRSELHRIEEVLDARLKHLEER